MFGEIFSTECVACRGISQNGEPFCTDCLKEIRRFEHKCENCGYPVRVPAKACGKCGGRPWNHIYIDFVYTGAVRRLLKQIKFEYRLTGFGSVLSLVQLPDKTCYDLVVFVPSHFTRNIRRFKHPAEIIAKHLSDNLHTKTTKALVRTRKTEYQYKLKKKMREKNVKDAFLCKINLTGLKILLVDDIITTGSTVAECCKVLRRAGASVVDVYAFSGTLH